MAGEGDEPTQRAGGTRRPARELFELTLYGGAPEARYRRLRPDVEQIDWSALSPKGSSRTDVEAARRGWTAAALQEYATASAHALLLRSLLRARVPLDLSAVVSRFPLDELAHAELCARTAGALGGGTPLEYARERVFPMSPRREIAPEIEAAELVIQNCVSESWSHELLHQAWNRESHPTLKKARGRLAKDEAGHGRFGWLFLDWLEPGLEKTDREFLRRYAARVVEVIGAGIREASDLPAAHFGRLTPTPFGKREFLSLATQALRERVEAPLRDRDLI